MEGSPHRSPGLPWEVALPMSSLQMATKSQLFKESLKTSENSHDRVKNGMLASLSSVLPVFKLCVSMNTWTKSWKKYPPPRPPPSDVHSGYLWVVGLQMISIFSLASLLLRSRTRKVYYV